MELDNTFWAFVGLVIFVGVLIYMKIPALMTKGLDSKIDKIQSDLDEAKRLREEAQALLAEYERKRKAAQAETDDIVTAAREEAERMSADAKVALEEMIVRRTKAVEEKISQAEAQAITEVRSRSADVAVEAARVVLQAQMKDSANDLVESAIKEVAGRLN